MSGPVRIDKMMYGGRGVSESGASIPFVLPGELVQPNGAQNPTILEASPDRTTPGCIHFGACGGCHYQDAAYPAQLRIKRTILRGTLTAAELNALPDIKVHSADPWHYRNRIRLRVGEAGGKLRVGYNRHDAAGGDPLLPITMCPIASPLLWRAAATMLELAKAEPAAHTWLEASIELEFFANAEESALQLVLFTRKPPAASFPSFCDTLKRVIPQLTGAGVAILPKQPSPQGRRFERTRSGPQWGAPGLMYKVDKDDHWVSRGAFFQVNRHIVSKLTALATAARTGALAWDLYAGIGLFSRALASSFAQVVAVEASEASAAGLAAALKGSSHRAISSTTVDFLRDAVVQRERPDLIVMDPPRAGVGLEVCALLARIRAPEIVYVSCDPVTLARDLKQLIQNSHDENHDGYKLSALHLVDMFPQTFHMETVAVLHR